MRADLSRLRSRRVVGLLLFLLLGPNVLLIVDYAAWRFELDRLGARATDSLRTHVASLRRELEKYEALPQVVALDPRVRLLLKRPDDKATADVVNRHLEDVNRATAAADVYVMNPQGITVAASNWNHPKPFVGENFAYRPYFKEALAGRRGKYFALGTTSGQRGYYFSSPVRIQGSIAGVSVVKVSMADLEAAWSSAGDDLLVTDADGVVFLAGNPAWNYGTLEQLSAATLQRIERSLRYAGVGISALPFQVSRTMDGGARIVQIDRGARQAGDEERVEYLMQSSVMPDLGWTVHILSSTAPARRSVLAALIIAGLAFAVVFLGVMYLLQRRDHAVERRRLRDEAHGSLQRAHEQLEQLVADRTGELQMSNEQLEREVDERLEAERVLRSTQDDLVQAGKLAALGQMAAEITHELNQPLTAIRGYADNAAALLERGRTGEAASNLSIIGDLTSRMASITRQLKAFARKSSGEFVEVTLAEVLDSVATLLEPRIHRAGIAFECVRPDASIRVFGDRVRLEQVLVNLCQNAIDAVAESAAKRVEVNIESSADTIVINVRDSGPGIDESALPKLFEPYFTTKDIGEGLGLGLAICYGIVKDHGGTIVAEGRTEGGAQFAVTLPRVSMEVAS